MASQVFDSTGAPVGRIGGPGDGIWADDNRHLCAVQPTGGNPFAATGDLVELDIHGGYRKVATTAGYGSHGGPGVVSCSVSQDRAIVFDSSIGQVNSIEEFRLSDGHHLDAIPRALAGSPCAHPQAVSGDGHVVAEGGSLGGHVCSADTGKALATIVGRPDALSWDGSLVIETLVHSGDGFSSEVVEWRSGQVRWTSPPPLPGLEGLGPAFEVAAQPVGGGGLAFTLNDHPPPDNPPPRETVDIWLVPPTGPASRISDSAAPGVI